MDAHEFRAWLEHHVAANAGIDTWLRRMTDEQAAKLLNSWRGLLKDVRLEDAKAATDELQRALTQPKGYGDHARAIYHLCQQRRHEHEAKCFRRACSYCTSPGSDSGPTGFVSIFAGGSPWESQYVQAYGQAGRLKQIAVGCTCPAGQALRVDVARYDPRRMVRCSAPLRHLPEADQARVMGADAY